MKILHSSDWHIGRKLYGRTRYDEFRKFLDWLSKTIREQQVEVLLVAGDIFDTTTPSHLAQRLYYQFLTQLDDSPCRHVVIIGGNHDSPSFLNAPKDLLAALHIHVVGEACSDIQDELIELHDDEGETELLVCAVPFLRERDLRLSEAGESLADKEDKLRAGLSQHYAEIVALTEKRRAELERPVPIVAMGHLFTAGGQSQDGDGVRDLYVGSLGHIAADIFSDSLDYVALGHLHIEQKVNKSEKIRYSGAPLAMSFGEARQSKSVCLLELPSQSDAQFCQVLEVPVFQKLLHIKGDLSQLLQSLSQLVAEETLAEASVAEPSKTERPGTWVEAVYDGEALVANLRETLLEQVKDSAVEILRVQNKRAIAEVLHPQQAEQSLDDLKPGEVFTRCLEVNEIPQEQQPELRAAFAEILTNLQQADLNAE